MYKLKIKSLNKEELEKLKEKYYNTNEGKEVKTRLDRVLIIGVIAIPISILFLFVQNSIWDIISSIALFIAGVFFIIASIKVKEKKLNNYLVKSKK